MIKAERIVPMQPYVAPEHKQLVESAEAMLKEYSDHLLDSIKEGLFGHGAAWMPSAADIAKAEISFREDPTRMALIKHLMDIKLIYERPRFMVKAQGNSDEQT